VLKDLRKENQIHWQVFSGIPEFYEIKKIL